MRTILEIRTRFTGYHKYPDAPADVGYLRFPHRHMFFVKLFIEVKHNNRELEFHKLKAALDEYLDRCINKQDVGSCEQCAEKIIEWADIFYPDRKLRVSVGEDDEFYAHVQN